MTENLAVAAAEGAATDDMLRRAAEGDEAAFASLYQHVHPRLRRYAWTLVGRDADDVTAEAWLQIVRDLGSFTGDLDRFRGWAARIVRNRALDHARARNRRPAEPITARHAATYVAPDDTAAAAEERITTDEALRLIAELPSDQAEAVMLRAVVGLDANAAGELLAKSGGAVRVAAHRGLRTLRRKLSAP